MRCERCRRDRKAASSTSPQHMEEREQPRLRFTRLVKHAVEGLTKSAALELASSGIRVNIVAPGPVDTEMLSRFTGTQENKARLSAGVPMKRIGSPEEIAEAIVFVSSDRASFITGGRIAVDGGKSAA